MQTCPYCGIPQNALKNHVRLSEGGGHGPSGSYPDDFDGAGGDAEGQQAGVAGHPGNLSEQGDVIPSEVSGTSSERRQAESDGGGTAVMGDEPHELSTDELEGMIDAAAESARGEVPANAGTPAKQSTTTNLGENSDPTVFDGEHCPLCGNGLVNVEEGTVFLTAFKKGIIRRRHEEVVVEGGDHLCRGCDIVVEPDGTMVPGSEYDPPADVH